MRFPLLFAALAASIGYAQPQPPDLAKSRETFQKVCGTCHTPESVITSRRSRDQWQEEIGRMVANGAKGTEEEVATVLDYLTSQFGRESTGDTPGRGRGGRGGRGAAPQPQGMLAGAGPSDKH